MKVYIMTDLEGVCGVNGRSDGIGNKIINTENACHLLTEEVNAAVDGLVDAGAKEIIVVDGHGGSNSIQIENLHPRAKLEIIGGGLCPVTYYLDNSYAAYMQIGTHAMQGTATGFMNHTFNSHSIANMWLNDTLVGEIAIGSLCAAYFGVPAILISGDRAACKEAVDFLGKVETVETKVASARYTAVNRSPLEVRQELRKVSARAFANRDKYPVKKIAAPYQLKIQFMCPNQADDYEKRGARRLDHQTVILQSGDFIDLLAQHSGWAPGIHNPRFEIMPAGKRKLKQNI